MVGSLQIATYLSCPGASVFDEMGQALLPGIEINRGNTLTRLDQGNRNMHCDGRFARSSLFVGYHDDTGGRHEASLFLFEAEDDRQMNRLSEVSPDSSLRRKPADALATHDL
jgi:hypothetical protein